LTIERCAKDFSQDLVIGLKDFFEDVVLALKIRVQSAFAYT
jgi:hypothetical protein